MTRQDNANFGERKEKVAEAEYIEKRWEKRIPEGDRGRRKWSDYEWDEEWPHS